MPVLPRSKQDHLQQFPGYVDVDVASLGRLFGGGGGGGREHGNIGIAGRHTLLCHCAGNLTFECLGEGGDGQRGGTYMD